jgi:hemolysin activation/secretion protein
MWIKNVQFYLTKQLKGIKINNIAYNRKAMHKAIYVAKFIWNNKMKKFFFIFFLIPSVAFSQTTPDAGKVLKQELDRDKRNEIPKKIPKNLIEKDKKKEIQPSDVKIEVNSFKLDGDIKAVTTQELQNLLLDLINKSLTFSQIQLAADRITNYYNEKGFFLAQAIIPKQEIQNGIVVILVNEGKLDSKEPYKINKKDLRISEDKVKAYLDESLKENLLKDSIERGLLNIRDNPGVVANINLEPGSEPGSTKIILDIKEGPLMQGGLTFDNYGNRYTGDLRASISVDVNDPSTIGDHISILGTKAIEGDLNLKKISYDLPIGFSGLRAGTSYSVVNFKIGKELTTNPLSTGKAEDINLNLKYPIYRSVSKTLMTNINYDKKYLYNTTTGSVTSDKEVDNYTFGITAQQIDSFFSGGFTQLNYNFTHGDLDLSKVASSLTSDQSATGYKTNGAFNKQNIQLSRIQQVTEKININLIADAQFASKNLDSSEKMSLGGPSGVRAYPVGEASGDEGYKYSADVKYNFANNTFIGDLSGSVFYDYGKIKQYKDTGITSVNNNNYSLSGYGVSLDSVSYNVFSSKLVWAHTNGSNPGASALGLDSDGKKDRNRFWILANLIF